MCLQYLTRATSPLAESILLRRLPLVRSHWNRAYTVKSRSETSRLLGYAHFKNPYSRPQNKIHSPHVVSNSSSGSALVAALVVGIAASAAFFIARPSPEKTSSVDGGDFCTSVSRTQEDILDYYLAMTTQVAPGRPGNLTPQQEAGLREFWRALLTIFGVSERATSTDVNGAAATTAAATADSPEKKKSRLNMFRRDKKEKDTKEPTDITDFSNIDENDKHGIGREFKRAMAEMSPDELRTAFWSMIKHDNPDAMLLRFLRARKWDVQAALVMMISAVHWRAKEMHVDDVIMKDGEESAVKDAEGTDAAKKQEGEMFLQQLKMGKSYLHGIDKEGRPLCFVRVRLHHGGEQSEASLERFTVHIMETARFLIKPPVDTATVVFDMTDFSMANMDYTPVKFMIKCFEANYPESLGHVLVHKAPWIFQGIWSIIKGWLDPVVANKVHFTRNYEELTSYINATSIPTELGGEEKWEYTYVPPVAGENALMSDTEGRDKVLAARQGIVSQLEEKTKQWIKEGPSDEERKALQEERMKLADELRKNYWEIDPYIRSKSFYDRTGVLSKDGRVDYYPSSAPVEEVEKKLETTTLDEKKPVAADAPPAAPTATTTNADDVD